MKRFFVMLYVQSGKLAIPMVEDDGETPMFFETPKEAKVAAERNFMGKNFGYDIFELGQGVD